MFFARKFDPSLDINPINSLEQSLGGIQSESQGWNSYWINNYHPLDRRDSSTNATVNLAKLILKSADCIEGKFSLDEVTTLFVKNQYFGEILTWTSVNQGQHQTLVRARQMMEVAEGHQHHLGRKIVFLEVGDKWDNREKIFRNHFKAFGPNSGKALHVQLKFGQSEVKRPMTLLLRLYNDQSKETCSMTRTTFWLRGQELVSLSSCKHTLSPGVWNLQVSVQQRSVAIVSFYIVSDSEESPILHQVQSSFYPVEDICAASSSSSEQSCYKNIQMCKMTEWSSLSNDFKSEFPSKN